MNKPLSRSRMWAINNPEKYQAYLARTKERRKLLARKHAKTWREKHPDKLKIRNQKTKEYYKECQQQLFILLDLYEQK